MTTPLEAKLIHDQIIAQSLVDPAFRKRLKEDPHTVFADMHLVIPAGYQVVVVEDTQRKKHMVLPVVPASGEITGEDMERPDAGIGHVAATGHFGFTR